MYRTPATKMSDILGAYADMLHKQNGVAANLDFVENQIATQAELDNFCFIHPDILYTSDTNQVYGVQINYPNIIICQLSMTFDDQTTKVYDGAKGVHSEVIVISQIDNKTCYKDLTPQSMIGNINRALETELGKLHRVYFLDTGTELSLTDMNEYLRDTNRIMNAIPNRGWNMYILNFHIFKPEYYGAPCYHSAFNELNCKAQPEITSEPIVTNTVKPSSAKKYNDNDIHNLNLYNG